MAHTPWQRRIRRAEHLAALHPFAAEILTFYIQAARFQEDLYQRLDRHFRDARVFLSSPVCLEIPELLTRFPTFLSLVEEHGPAPLAKVANDLRNAPPILRAELLNAVCSESGVPPSDAGQFLAFSFLQPYAELARSRASLQHEGYVHPLCPFCNRKPVLSVLRPLGDGARRSLLCGFCLTEWEFRRIVCPGCGHEDHAKLPVYTAETFPYIRVECCDACRAYVKSIDLTKNGLAEPLVDELASVPLDLWAQQRGYSKLYPNLLGM